MPRTWSAYADVVSDDGARALIVRVSHDPQADRAEIWVHAFVDGDLLAHMSAHPCPAIGASTTGDAHRRVEFDLEGRRLVARVTASRTERSAYGEGTIPIGVTLSWSGEGWRGSNRTGRDEQLVRVDATLEVDGQGVGVSGWGHQHTQWQDHPRFGGPFTYLSLRGDDAGVVGLVSGELRRGFGHVRGEPFTASTVVIDPPAERRELRMTGTSAGPRGQLVRTYRYWIPMGGTWRDGSIVTGTLDGLPVSGVINDFAGPVG